MKKLMLMGEAALLLSLTVGARHVQATTILGELQSDETPFTDLLLDAPESLSLDALGRLADGLAGNGVLECAYSLGDAGAALGELVLCSTLRAWTRFTAGMLELDSAHLGPSDLGLHPRSLLSQIQFGIEAFVRPVP